MDNFKNIMTLIFGCNANFKIILESSDDGNFNISTLQKGDLILRKMIGTRKKIYHAGIFCGQNDVIQFAAILNNTSNSLCSSSVCQTVSQHNGQVDKVSVKKFISDQKTYVYRLMTGLPQDLQENINNAMDDSQPYHFFKNNCLHFALRLLGGTPGPMPESQPNNKDEESDPEEGECFALTTQN